MREVAIEQRLNNEHCADLGVEAVCRDGRLLFQYLGHKNSIEAVELI